MKTQRALLSFNKKGNIAIKLALAIVVLTIVGLLIAFWTFPQIIENRALKTLNILGAQEASLEVSEVSLNHIKVNDIAFKHGIADIKLQQITSRFTLPQLVNETVDSVTIENLDLGLDLRPLFILDKKNEMEASKAFFIDTETLWNLPLNKFMLANSQLRLKFPHEDTFFDISAFIEEGSPKKFLLLADAPKENLSLGGELSLDKREGNISFQSRTRNFTQWLKTFEPILKLKSPLINNATVDQTHVDVGAKIGNGKIGQWLALIESKHSHTHSGDLHLDIEELVTGASGYAKTLRKHWLIATQGKLQKANTTLQWMRLAYDIFDSEQLKGQLHGLRLSHSTPASVLGEVSLITAPLQFAIQAPVFDLSTLAQNHYQLMASIPMKPVKITTERSDYTADGTVSIKADYKSETFTGEIDVNLENIATAFYPDGTRIEKFNTTLHYKQDGAFTSKSTIQNGFLSWKENTGSLEGLNGQVDVNPLGPAYTSRPQHLTFAHLKQGDFEAHNGHIHFELNRTQDDLLQIDATVQADFLGGSLQVKTTTHLTTPIESKITLSFENVDLAKLAAFAPQFKGELSGRVRGELSVGLTGKQLKFYPSSITLMPGTEGKLKYLQKGWLTQDPSIDIDAIIEELNEDELMFFLSQDSSAYSHLSDKIDFEKVMTFWPQIITEISMRDLTLDTFEAQLYQPENLDRPVFIKIKGNSDIKGITAPVILDIPVHGPLEELINYVLHFQLNIQS